MKLPIWQILQSILKNQMKQMQYLISTLWIKEEWKIYQVLAKEYLDFLKHQQMGIISSRYVRTALLSKIGRFNECHLDSSVCYWVWVTSCTSLFLEEAKYIDTYSFLLSGVKRFSWREQGIFLCMGVDSKNLGEFCLGAMSKNV